MTSYVIRDRHSSLEGTAAASFTSIASDRSISYLIARVLRVILPRTWFCWVSRATVLLQSILRPKAWSYWTKLSDHIYLGAMPLKNWRHIKALTGLKIKAVLSINEAYELRPQLFAHPVTSADWEERKITFLNIPSPDLEPIEVSKLAAAVQFVADQVRLGHTPVYIHCTAGRARSVAAAICSVIQIYSLTLEESVKYIKQLRSHCMLNQRQMNNVITWYRERDVRRGPIHYHEMQEI